MNKEIILDIINSENSGLSHQQRLSEIEDYLLSPQSDSVTKPEQSKGCPIWSPEEYYKTHSEPQEEQTRELIEELREVKKELERINKPVSKTPHTPPK